MIISQYIELFLNNQKDYSFKKNWRTYYFI